MSNYRLQIATATHVGDRSYQQDKVTVIQHPYSPKCLLAIVADGMGGQSGGAKASGQVVETANQLLPMFDIGRDSPQQLLQQIVRDAHAVIRMINVSSEDEPHTTIAAFMLMPDGRCHWIHSGDSRIYHFRQGHMYTRTRDHSYVQSLIDSGEITERDAIHHPHSNILLGCLGMPTDPPFSEFDMGEIQRHDVVLACSDGLWGHVSDQEMAKITGTLAPREACEQLIGLARSRGMGGGDNISVVILKARSPTSVPIPTPGT